MTYKIVYRRRKNSDCWHWCTSCQHWPKFSRHASQPYKEQSTKPSTGERCNECLRRKKRGEQ